jgi:hypothetical protein
MIQSFAHRALVLVCADEGLNDLDTALCHPFKAAHHPELEQCSIAVDEGGFRREELHEYKNNTL